MKISDLPEKYQRQALAQLGQLPPPEPHVKRVEHQPVEMTKAEQEWYEILKARGYKYIHCQDINLRVGEGKAWYKCDFFVGDVNTFWEVKGEYIYDDAKVKLRAAAKAYPTFRWVMAQRIKGSWTETVIHDPTTGVDASQTVSD